MTVQNTFPAPQNAVIVKSTIPVFVLAHTKAATVSPRMCVQSAGDDDADDNLEIIFGASMSKLITGWVLFNLANKLTLGENTADPLKSSTFAIADGVWIGMRIPVVEAILATRQGTLLPGQRYVCDGSGVIKAHPDDLYNALVQSTGWGFPTSTGSGNTPLDPTIAIGLSHVTTADATQVIQVLPLW